MASAEILTFGCLAGADGTLHGVPSCLPLCRAPQPDAPVLAERRAPELRVPPAGHRHSALCLSVSLAVRLSEPHDASSSAPPAQCPRAVAPGRDGVLEHNAVSQPLKTLAALRGEHLHRLHR